MERYYDEILQAAESADFTRGDMMVLLKAINDGLAPTPIETPSSTPGPWPPLPALATKNPASLVDERGSNLGAYDLWGVDWLHATRPVREDRIRELPWVRDGIGVSEMEAVQGLILLGLYGSSLFFDVMEQQWVLEGRNGPAMSSLGQLAATDQEAFEGVMAHPTVSDGISDQEAAIVATLWRVQLDAPSLVEVLLDPEQTTLEERTITLPLAGHVPVTIIRTKLGAAVTMDRIEAAASTASEDIGGLLFTFKFSHQDVGSFHVPVQIVEAYEDGFIYRRQRKTLTPADQGTETVWVPHAWPRAIGKHWVIVYAGDRKVAQVKYEVTP